jgi:hypothetical protein
MPKRRTSPSGDLRTSVVSLDVTRIHHLQGLREQAQKHWKIRNLQPYFPAMEPLFKLDHVKMPFHYGLKVGTPVQTIATPDKIFAGSSEQTIYRKTTMLLSPYRWMKGDFGCTGLPVDQDTSEEIRDKIHMPHNAAYVGALIATLLSESPCAHFPKVFGTFVGLAENYEMNLSDDYEELCQRPWFIQNIGHFFDLRLKQGIHAHEHQQPALQLDDSDLVIDATPLEPLAPSAPSNTMPEMEEVNLTSDEEDEEDTDTASLEYIFGIESCHSEGQENGVEEEDEEPFAFAIFHDVQVQTTLLEKCAGTLHELFKQNLETEKRVAWLYQIVFALAYAQRTFGFVHNDLHVNNIMYVPTTKEYFYYNHAGVVYRVPTFGYLLKIIDFERSTFSVKLPGMREARFFMSNQFEPDEEAGGQYNTDPFYIQKYPEIKPNPSFDLVRLAYSLFWDCFPEGPLHEEYKSNSLFQILISWLTLPDGKSIFFRDLEKKDIHDRYHGFHIYKAIARYCKDTAVPRKQIEKCDLFKIDRVPAGEPCLIIEA